jgi:hypothetical protein
LFLFWGLGGYFFMRTIIGFVVGVSAGVYLAKWLSTDKGIQFQEDIFAKASQIFGEESINSFRQNMGFSNQNTDIEEVNFDE